jgi:nicotinamide-nucleotide amidase
MVEQPLLSYLGKRYGRRANGCSLTVRFVGLGQSQIDQTMKDHIRLPQHLILASQFSDGRVDFTFSLPEDSPPNRAVLDELRRGLQQHLGEYIYATDDSTTLEQAVVALLAERAEKLCLLEIGSGGSLAAAISSVGSPHAEVLDAGYVSTTTAGLRDMLPVAAGAETDASTQEQLDEILRAARSRYPSHWLVAIGPQQGAAGREFVEAAFDQPQRQPESIRLPLSNSTRSSRDRLTTMVLDQLRRRLQAAR